MLLGFKTESELSSFSTNLYNHIIRSQIKRELVNNALDVESYYRVGDGYKSIFLIIRKSLLSLKVICQFSFTDFLTWATSFLLCFYESLSSLICHFISFRCIRLAWLKSQWRFCCCILEFCCYHFTS